MLTYPLSMLLMRQMVFSLKLGSDIPQGAICTGLSPSPVRFDFPTLCTVFVKVFYYLSCITDYNLALKNGYCQVGDEESGRICFFVLMYFLFSVILKNKKLRKRRQ